MSTIIGLIIIFFVFSLIFKIVFGVIGLAFKITFGVIEIVFGILGAIIGGGLLAVLGFAIVGGVLFLPVLLFARKR